MNSAHAVRHKPALPHGQEQNAAVCIAFSVGGDLLNVGGTKVPPAELEELVLRTIDAKDTGVCSARNSDGIEEIWIAVVDCQIAGQELVQRLEQALKRMQFGTFHVIRLAGVPRNASGKIERDRLKTAMMAAAGRTSD
jgi:acyl-coenzyme A synthetase/AMP-(fatty) acid ligase